uniref:Craniofacial development protein 1 n=1 Tax=Sphenodon punctatus TaxID=8508 RepID=A0A8D0GZK6_SPHPU
HHVGRETSFQEITSGEENDTRTPGTRRAPPVWWRWLSLKGSQLWNIDKLLTVAVPHWLAHSAGRGKFCDNMVKCKILQKWLQLQKQHRIPGALVLGQSVTGVCYAISIRVKRPSSMSSLLGKMGAKKQKMSTLEKSKLDWESFKEEEGIGEELAIHNRGKEGYLERKAFLERVDHRQFEIERDIRLSKMKP